MTKGLTSCRKRLEDYLALQATPKGANQKAFTRMRLNKKKKIKSLPYVSNVIGSAGKRCPCKCKSWLDHWVKGAQPAIATPKCFVRNCRGNAAVGAHVHVKGKGNKQHILPFCSFHNGRAVTVALILKNQKIKLAVPAYDKV